MPATVLNVPQVCSSYVCDIDGGYFAEEDGSEKGGYEGDAGGRLVGFRILVVEPKDLGATEALS
jgi:hypothetical protein